MGGILDDDCGYESNKYELMFDDKFIGNKVKLNTVCATKITGKSVSTE